MKVYGQLEKAQLENIASGSVPAAGTSGRLWFNTTTGMAQLDISTGIVNIVGDSLTQTLSNKSFSDALTLAEIATPSNPAASNLKLYAKSDDNLYFLNSAGVETKIATASSSGLPKASRVTKTANYTLTSSDDVVLADASGGDFTLTLPTAVGKDGKLFFVKNINALGTVTVATTGGQTIDGDASLAMTFPNAVTLVSDNANWYIL
jgi:hypothetical protein